MKRLIACMLMTVVLLLSLSVPAQAGMLTTQPDEIVSLWNADENWGDRYTLDTQNQTEGEGCISINLNGVTGTHAPSKKLDPVDATGMLAFEFDMYISDLAILDHLQNVSSSSIEICSGGKCDEGEKNIPLSDVAKQLKNGCPKVGWNRVIVFLNKMRETKGSYGPFDISHINYLRIYWTDMTDCGEDWVLKFDNFVLTDRQAAPNPHTPTEWQYDENKHWRYCTECDKKIDENAHSPFYWTNSPRYSTNTNLCEEEFTCYDCGQVCGPYEHEFTWKEEGTFNLAENPTCTHGRLYYYLCARCGEQGEETFEIGQGKGHSLAAHQSCGAEGHATICENCDERVSEVFPHQLSDWVIGKEATETEDGLKYRECDLCVYVEEEVIPKTGTSTDGELGKGKTPGCTSVVGGVPLLAAMGFAVALAIKKKK